MYKKIFTQAVDIARGICTIIFIIVLFFFFEGEHLFPFVPKEDDVVVPNVLLS